MPFGIQKQILGTISQSKTTGKAFLKELYKAYEVETIMNDKPETQEIKKNKKK